MEVQKYLRSKSLEALKVEYGVIHRFSTRYPNLVLLKYSQIESPMGEKIVQECRGLILDSSDWEVVARPYDKFFNYGESNAATLDLKTTKALAKLDGSLCVLYFYAGEWHVATSGSPDASGQVGSNEMTFKDLFWQTWGELGYQLPTGHEEYCFIFELETKFNRIVTRREDSRITLHGIRHRDGHELRPRHGIQFGWWIVREHEFDSLDSVVEMAEKLDPLEQEGFVLVDKEFNRVKIKSSQYVRLHHLRDQCTPVKMMSVIVNSESDEFLTYFPEWREEFTRLQFTYDAAVNAIALEYEKFKEIENQKDFALAVAESPYKAVLFALRAGKVSSIQDYFRKITKLDSFFVL